MENESVPIRFEKEMGTLTCVHRLKVYLLQEESLCPINIPSVSNKCLGGVLVYFKKGALLPVKFESKIQFYWCKIILVQ